MGNKEFHQMLGKLIDTKGTTETGRLKEAVELQGNKGAQTPEEILKEIASREGIQLEQQDITDLVNCIKELDETKGSSFARSPRN